MTQHHLVLLRVLLFQSLTGCLRSSRTHRGIAATTRDSMSCSPNDQMPHRDRANCARGASGVRHSHHQEYKLEKHQSLKFSSLLA